MAFRFQKANSVAAGAFNVYIVQPQWLATKRLLPANLEVTIETKLDEPGFRFSSPKLKVNWMVTPTRIVIETEDPQEDCGRIMADLLKLLPETPLEAVGNNTYYATGAGEGVEDLPAYPLAQALSGFKAQQRTFHIALSNESRVQNLHLVLTDNGAELLSNAHCPVSGEQRSVLAQDHLKRFMEHRREGADLARHHLKVSFDV